MNWRYQCAVVIPCFNEARTIGSLVQSVRRLVPTVVVVDDGSFDHTGRFAEASGACVIRHEQRRGKGAALRTGIEWVCARQFPWVLFMDGDGQHAPEDIPAFFSSAEREPRVSLVIGNRMENSARMPWLRRHVNRWMSRRISRLTGQDLPDSQCGFRLLRSGVWDRLDSRAAHFEVESELLTAVLLTGGLVRFIPIQVVYAEERTKIRPFRDGLRWCRWWYRARAAVKERSNPQAETELANPEPILPVASR